jgi:hypothetical protein
MRNELHHTAESRDSHYDENDSRHECRDNQSVDAEFLDNAVDDDDERARRSANLNPGAAQGADEKAGNNGRPKTATGSDAARNRECNCERERDYADNYAGNRIIEKLFTIVVLERRYNFGNQARRDTPSLRSRPALSMRQL